MENWSQVRVDRARGSENVQERVASVSAQENYFFKLIVNCHGFSFFKSKNPD